MVSIRNVIMIPFLFANTIARRNSQKFQSIFEEFIVRKHGAHSSYYSRLLLPPCGCVWFAEMSLLL